MTDVFKPVRGLGAVLSALIFGLSAAPFSSAFAASLSASVDAQASEADAAADTSADFWQQDVWKQDDRGFLWYPPEDAKPVQPPKPAPRELASITSMEELREERERRLSDAIMQPTPENMKLYLEVNAYVQEKSALFADQWQRTLWENPSFDFTARHPSANFAQVALTANRKTERTNRIAALKSTHGLLYFYSGSCAFCHLQNPLIAELAKTTGLEVLAVSVDGAESGYFPGALPDNGIARAVFAGRPVTTPALFLLDKATMTPQAVSTGVVAVEDLLKRIDVLTKPLGGTLFGGADAK
jgi:conjugal transfer pilus assembly protein TraF